MTLPKTPVCDGCDKPISPLKSYKGMDLCASCYQVEKTSTEAMLSQDRAEKTIPVGSKRFSTMTVQQEINKRSQEYISMNHQDFFNQEVEEVKDLSLEELRARIEEMSEGYFGAEAELIRRRTKFQAACSIFNDKSSKVSETEREALRMKDSSYVPKKLANPLTQKSPEVKKAKAKKSLEDSMASLFGDKSDEMMKKLLGG